MSQGRPGPPPSTTAETVFVCHVASLAGSVTYANTSVGLRSISVWTVKSIIWSAFLAELEALLRAQHVKVVIEDRNLHRASRTAIRTLIRPSSTFRARPTIPRLVVRQQQVQSDADDPWRHRSARRRRRCEGRSNLLADVPVDGSESGGRPRWSAIPRLRGGSSGPADRPTGPDSAARCCPR